MEQIGRFKILRRLGSGGFGEVWLGHDDYIDRDVAIKVFKPKDENLIAFATSSDTEGLDVLRSRFVNEARILGSLEDTTWVINVLDFGELDDGSPYYVMPYLPRSLSDLLGKDVFESVAVAELPERERPRSLPLDQSLVLLEQILEGLAAAHAKGLVHRDIKPSNIMLSENDEIRIVDFGIAKAPDGVHSTVSQLGMGSRNYMAPEQRQSAKHVDATADVYAIGAVAYRMITGRLPEGRFSDPNVVVPALHQQINDLIVSCLNQDKADRPENAGEVLKQFHEASSQQGEVDESTGTWVATGSASIRDALKPLRDQIEKLILQNGDIPADENSKLQAIASIVDLDDAGLQALIDAVTDTHINTVKPIQNLRRLVDQQIEAGNLDQQALHAAGSTIGWDEGKVDALIASRTALVPVPVSVPSTGRPSKLGADTSVKPSASGIGLRSVVIVVVLLLVGGAGYRYYDQQQQAAAVDRVVAGQQAETERQDLAAWGKAMQTNTIAGYEGYRSLSLATLAHKDEAATQITALRASAAAETANAERATRARLQGIAWDNAEQIKTLSGYEAYLAQAYTTPSRIEQANARIDQIRQSVAAEEEKTRQARLNAASAKQEQQAWSLAENKNTIEGYKTYQSLLVATAARKAEAVMRIAKLEALPKPGKIFKDCDDCPEMVVIPSGSFQMGSNDGSDYEKPVHRVTIGRSFALGRTEVTFAQYDVFARSTNRGLPGDTGWGRGGRPVINVSWDDAVAYAKWLSVKTGKGYRLPSEAEWEYAARSGSTTKYSVGNTISCSQARYGHYSGDCGNERKTTSVGSYAANGFGLFDMHGNVWEWTQDCWNGSYSGAPAAGDAWLSGDCDRRVVRGGAWNSFPSSLRSANRNWYDIASRNSGIGFRLAQDLPF